MCITLLAGLLLTSTALADPIQLSPIAVSWAPTAAPDVWVLEATIPAAEAVIGWGLDLYTPATVVSYGSLWSEIGAATPDPDDASVALNFAAIGTFPPGSVFGANVPLATIQFATAITPTWQLVGAHLNDLNEGFAVDPLLIPTGYARTAGVTPEPATLALLGLGALALLRRR
jgi:hypothetical protein